MDDFVVGYNRTVINKQDVLEGYKLINRGDYIINYLIALIYFAIISICVIIISIIPVDVQIILLAVGISSLVIVIAARVQKQTLMHRDVNQKFQLNDEMTLYFTFYHKFLSVDISVGNTNLAYSMQYSDITKIHYNQDIVMISHIDRSLTLWFNPLFLRNITIHDLLELIKNENNNIKIIKGYEV